MYYTVVFNKAFLFDKMYVILHNIALWFNLIYGFKAILGNYIEQTIT